jgi:hypothetical protein
MMTNVTAERDTERSEMIEAAAIARLEEYEPAAAAPDQIWPPPVSCQSWENQTLPNAIHYARDDVREIMKLIGEHDLDKGEILISDFRNGLPALLWEGVFPKVVSILGHTLAGHEPIIAEKQTILFGKAQDTLFLYKAMEYLSNLKLLLIDDVYYGNVISLYFMFKQLIKPGGAVVFLNSGNRVSWQSGMYTFLSDLKKGVLDNRRHTLVPRHQNPRGYGITYELIN